MPRYDPNTEEGREVTSRITCVKLDGKVIFKAGEYDKYDFLKAADTDEGWVDVYETEVINGKRHVKMTPWRSETKAHVVDGQVVIPKQVRDFIIKRLTGKVEVEFK